MAAEVGLTLAGLHACDAASAARTGRAGLSMNLQEIPDLQMNVIAHPLFDDGDRLLQDLLNRTEQFLGFILRQVFRLRKG